MDNQNKILLKASLLVVLSAILYGFLGYLGTQLIRSGMTINAMLFWRFFVAGCWMLIFVIKNHSQIFTKNKINLNILLFMFFLGAIGYSGSSGFYFLATDYTGTGIAMVIFFLYPIMVALFAWITQQTKMSVMTLLTIVLMLSGLFLLQNSPTHRISFIGIFFAICSAASYALYILGSKKFSSAKINTSLLTVIVCFGSGFIFLLLTLIQHGFSLPNSLRNYLDLLALGILATALPIQLMLEGLKHISSVRASIISVLEPLVTVFVGVLLLHETISLQQGLGIIILLTSTILVQFQKGL